MTRTIPRPATGEFAPFYAGYIAEVPVGASPLEMLASQLESVPDLLATVPESRAGYRYAPEKWSIKEVLGHLCDGERVFAYRMMRIARGDATPLPGFDEGEFVRAGDFDARPLADIVAEWTAARRATLMLARGLGDNVWGRMGDANGSPVSAGALLHIMVGHTEHHVGVLRSRYGVGKKPL
jgi:hypothetical protein